MSAQTNRPIISSLLIPLSSGIALSFGGCSDDEPSAEELLQDNLVFNCQISAACDEDFSYEHRSVDECTEAYTARIDGYMSEYVSSECRSRLVSFFNCAADIAFRAYQARGCEYQNHLGEFGADIIEDEYSSYYFSCSDEYDALFEPPCDYYDTDDCSMHEEGEVGCTSYSTHTSLESLANYAPALRLWFRL